MKKSIILFALATCFFTSCGQTSNHANATSGSEFLSAFYNKYASTFLNVGAGIAGEEKLKSLQREVCTKSLMKKIPQIIEETEADPFLKAQDFDMSFLRTLSVVQGQKDNEFIVSYASGELFTDTTNIYITLDQDETNYYISSIK